MDSFYEADGLSDVPDRIRPALFPLLEAIEYAEQTSGDYWEFAVEVDRLIKLGLTLNDFRWLVRNVLVEHQREVTLEIDNGREFRPTGDLAFPDRTCFVLTDNGIALARECCGNAAFGQTVNPSTFPADNRNGGTARVHHTPLTNHVGYTADQHLPTWDCERRVLSVNGTTVKYFRWAAANQEAVLSAFEEEDWPPRIDDPLPPHPDQDSKRRLSDTIKCLNRKQRSPIIHFRGDGTGEGIIWELVELCDSDDAP